MPISYSIDKQKNVILEVWNGDISAADLANYWRQYLADPDVMSIRRTLVDIRQANILFSGEQLSQLVENIVLPALKGRHWKTALLVARPVQYGKARQYQAFAERYSHDAIFYDFDTAVEWLLHKG
jgi:hypothetical protein